MKISAASQGRVPSREFTGTNEIAHLGAAIRHSASTTEPWRHRLATNFFPADMADALPRLPLNPPIAAAPSGRREYGNGQRIYFDRANMARFPLMRRVAEAMQSRAVVSTVQNAFGTALAGTFLRIEYALDTDGFWLEPHTDIGVKKFTCFVYLDGAGDLGTDLYADAQTFACRMPFVPNSALAFIPGESTWHGFAPRPIEGVRRSLIINYVSAEWRAREQLSFPDAPVRLAR
jgi:hypothetical protein